MPKLSKRKCKNAGGWRLAPLVVWKVRRTGGQNQAKGLAGQLGQGVSREAGVMKMLMGGGGKGGVWENG